MQVDMSAKRLPVRPLYTVAILWFEAEGCSLRVTLAITNQRETNMASAHIISLDVSRTVKIFSNLNDHLSCN